MLLEISKSVMVTHKGFLDIPDTLLCGSRQFYIIVEGRRPHCWTCGITGHLSKTCPKKNPVLQPKVSALEEAVVTNKDKKASEHQEWEMLNRVMKAVSLQEVVVPS